MPVLLLSGTENQEQIRIKIHATVKHRCVDSPGI
jgi:hypothetical protein